MAYDRLKSLVLRLLRAGVPVPELALSRIQEYRQIQRVLVDQRINCVIDVGANRGQTARVLRSLGYKGPIHSFEPHGASYSVLHRRAKADQMWWTYRMALGEEPASRTLQANLTFPEMNSLLQQRGTTDQLRPEMVEIEALDNLFPELVKHLANPRVFLKIDTEGYDLHVFRGARDSLDRIYALQAELFVAPVFQGAAHYLDVLQEFESAGFKLDHISTVSYTAQADLMCLNCLLTPRERRSTRSPGHQDAIHPGKQDLD